MSLLDRLGRCYELSAKTLTCFGPTIASDKEDVVLIHGSVISQFGYGRIGHAWVEWTDNGQRIAHDPVFGDTMPADVYRDTREAIVERAYSEDDAVIEMVNTGHYGPWEETDADRV